MLVGAFARKASHAGAVFAALAMSLALVPWAPSVSAYHAPENGLPDPFSGRCVTGASWPAHNPPGPEQTGLFLEFASDADVFASPYYIDGDGTETDPAVLHIDGCLQTFIAVHDVGVSVVFAGLTLWDIADSSMYGSYVPLGGHTECDNHPAAFCVWNMPPTGKVTIRDAQPGHGVAVVTAVGPAHVVIDQSHTGEIPKAGGIGHALYGATIDVVGVVWHGIDVETLVRSAQLNVLASRLHTWASWCLDDDAHALRQFNVAAIDMPIGTGPDATLDSILADLAPPGSNVGPVPIPSSAADPVLAAASQLGLPADLGWALDEVWDANLAEPARATDILTTGPVIPGDPPDLEMTMFRLEDYATMLTVGSVFGGAFIVVENNNSHFLGLGNVLSCSGWGVVADYGQITSVRNKFSEVTVPFKLTNVEDIQDQLWVDINNTRNGGAIKPMEVILGGGPVFRSVCDIIKASHPAVVISDRVVSLLGTNFQDGWPLHASEAAIQARLYGGMDDVVPIPDNIRLVFGMHDDADIGVCPGAWSLPIVIPAPYPNLPVPNAPNLPQRCQLTNIPGTGLGCNQPPCQNQIIGHYPQGPGGVNPPGPIDIDAGELRDIIDGGGGGGSQPPNCPTQCPVSLAIFSFCVPNPTPNPPPSPPSPPTVPTVPPPPTPPTPKPVCAPNSPLQIPCQVICNGPCPPQCYTLTSLLSCTGSVCGGRSCVIVDPDEIDIEDQPEPCVGDICVTAGGGPLGAPPGPQTAPPTESPPPDAVRRPDFGMPANPALPPPPKESPASPVNVRIDGPTAEPEVLPPGDDEEDGPSTLSSHTLLPFPFWQLTDGSCNPITLVGGIPAIGIVNVPMVDPSLTAIHYLVAAPIGTYLVAGFYNFAVDTPLTPVTPSYGFTTDMTLLGLGDVSYCYTEDSLADVCMVCPTVDAVVNTATGALGLGTGWTTNTFTACAQLEINIGTALEVVGTLSRAATSCGETGTGTAGSHHKVKVDTITATLDLIPGPRRTEGKFLAVAEEMLQISLSVSQDLDTFLLTLEQTNSLLPIQAFLSMEDVESSTILVTMRGGAKSIDGATFTFEQVAYQDGKPGGTNGLLKIERLCVGVKTALLGVEARAELCLEPITGPKTVRVQKSTEYTDANVESTQVDMRDLVITLLLRADGVGELTASLTLYHEGTDFLAGLHIDDQLGTFVFDTERGYVGSIALAATNLTNCGNASLYIHAIDSVEGEFGPNFKGPTGLIRVATPENPEVYQTRPDFGFIDLQISCSLIPASFQFKLGDIYGYKMWEVAWDNDAFDFEMDSKQPVGSDWYIFMSLRIGPTTLGTATYGFSFTTYIQFAGDENGDSHFEFHNNGQTKEGSACFDKGWIETIEINIDVFASPVGTAKLDFVVNKLQCVRWQADPGLYHVETAASPLAYSSSGDLIKISIFVDISPFVGTTAMADFLFQIGDVTGPKTVDLTLDRASTHYKVEMGSNQVGPYFILMTLSGDYDGNTFDAGIDVKFAGDESGSSLFRIEHDGRSGLSAVCMDKGWIEDYHIWVHLDFSIQAGFDLDGHLFQCADVTATSNGTNGRIEWPTNPLAYVGGPAYVHFDAYALDVDLYFNIDNLVAHFYIEYTGGTGHQIDVVAEQDVPYVVTVGIVLNSNTYATGSIDFLPEVGQGNHMQLLYDSAGSFSLDMLKGTLADLTATVAADGKGATAVLGFMDSLKANWGSLPFLVEYRSPDDLSVYGASDLTFVIDTFGFFINPSLDCAFKNLQAPLVVGVRADIDPNTGQSGYVGDLNFQGSPNTKIDCDLSPFIASFDLDWDGDVTANSNTIAFTFHSGNGEPLDAFMETTGGYIRSYEIDILLGIVAYLKGDYLHFIGIKDNHFEYKSPPNPSFVNDPFKRSSLFFKFLCININIDGLNSADIFWDNGLEIESLNFDYFGFINGDVCSLAGAHIHKGWHTWFGSIDAGPISIPWICSFPSYHGRGTLLLAPLVNGYGFEPDKFRLYAGIGTWGYPVGTVTTVDHPHNGVLDPVMPPPPQYCS